MLFYTFLPNPKTDKDKDSKNATIDSYNSSNLLLANLSENNSSNRNLLKMDDVIDKAFSNNKNEEKFMLISKKAKQVLFKNPIEAMELYFKNLEMKDMASFYRIKNMAELG